MRIGLIDVDSHRMPNLPIMKLSAWHKAQGDTVEWYDTWNGLYAPYDVVYMSKIFSFTPDYQQPIYAEKVIKGGSGYCISLVDGKEVFDKSKDKELPYEIEHIFPDYSIYPEYEGTAYGFLTRGCPRGCNFCHVKAKEGLTSHKVADLSEFWNGQKNIEILDPNILAAREWRELLQQLIDSKAWVNFNQGLDIRMMNEEKAVMLTKIKMICVHFAWDCYEDKEIILPKFKEFRKISKIQNKKLFVYVLCGDKEQKILSEDLERIYWLRDNGYAPYVMLYNKESLPKGHELIKLQRWVNNRFIFWNCNTFEEYKQGYK